MRRLAIFCCLRKRPSPTPLHRLLRAVSTAPPRCPTHGAPQQTGEVVTRLAPSQRMPGLRGVYLTKAVRKFHHIQVLPTAATSTPLVSSDMSTAEPCLRPSPPTNHASATECSTALRGGRDGATVAPPLVLNVAFAPRHHISLRRFLALRHMFSTTAYLHVATEHGWYLITPSSAAPLCADVAGLEKWTRLHHHRYLKHAPASNARLQKDGTHRSGHGPAATAAGQARASSPREVRLAKHAELAKLEAALDNGEELTEAQLRALADQERKARDEHDDEGDGDEEEGQDDDGDGDGNGDVDADLHTAPPSNERPDPAASDASSGKATVAAAVPPPQLKCIPPLITESHLFEINDGVLWELPPSDDLANHDYWKGHRQRMTLYESTGDADAAEQREALLNTIRCDPKARSCTEQELHAAAASLFQALKQKANVVLSVDSESGLLSLVPLVDLEAGDELFLHYGREWWTGRLLSSLLLAVSDSEMPHIRWIEQFFRHDADRNEYFPLIIPAHRQRKRQGRAHKTPPSSSHRSNSAADRGEMGGKGEVVEDKSTASASAETRRGPVVLYNTVTRGKATDAAVLAFAIRRSCVEQAFFDRLVLGNPARGVLPVFRLSEPDAEIPMRVLRKILLASLRGVKEEGEVSDAGLQDTAGHSANAELPREYMCRDQESGLSDQDADDGDGVFSV